MDILIRIIKEDKDADDFFPLPEKYHKYLPKNGDYIVIENKTYHVLYIEFNYDFARIIIVAR